MGGVLTELGDNGIYLGDEDPVIVSPTHGAVVEPPTEKLPRLVKSPAGGDGIEIHYADGTKLVATPFWWEDQKRWIFTVTVSETTATKGIMGLTKDGWLPALPNGDSLGKKPALDKRYGQFYVEFANAWRVTAETSLFTYKEGTGTKDFTNRDWPGENSSACTITGEPTAQPIDAEVAKRLCSAVVDENNKANCIFDVSVTGHRGFAKTYETSEKLVPGLTQTTARVGVAAVMADDPCACRAVSVVATAAPIALANPMVNPGKVNVTLPSDVWADCWKEAPHSAA